MSSGDPTLICECLSKDEDGFSHKRDEGPHSPIEIKAYKSSPVLKEDIGTTIIVGVTATRTGNVSHFGRWP
jgi:hypothetical protein